MVDYKQLVLLLVTISICQASISYTSPKLANQKVDVDLCGTCVTFADESLDVLLNVILNKYIIGGCDDLCSYLKTELNKIVCNVLCDYVGIKAFIEAIEAADLDPIYYCELMGQCPVVDGGAGNITSIVVAPTSGTLGITFQIVVEFTITNRTSTGMSAINVQPPGPYESVGGAYLNEGYMPGNYQMRFEIDTSEPVDQNGDPYPTGDYQVEIDLCSGTCGSKHPHAFLLSNGTTSFTINERIEIEV